MHVPSITHNKPYTVATQVWSFLQLSAFALGYEVVCEK